MRKSRTRAPSRDRLAERRLHDVTTPGARRHHVHRPNDGCLARSGHCSDLRAETDKSTIPWRPDPGRTHMSNTAVTRARRSVAARRRGSQRGIVAVEFAFVLPLLVM